MSWRRIGRRFLVATFVALLVAALWSITVRAQDGDDDCEEWGEDGYCLVWKPGHPCMGLEPYSWWWYFWDCGRQRDAEDLTAVSLSVHESGHFFVIRVEREFADGRREIVVTLRRKELR